MKLCRSAAFLLGMMSAGFAVAQQTPGWRDYYAAMGGPEREAQAQLELYKAQITLRNATQEHLSASLTRCKDKDLKGCANAALDIATLQNIYAQWLVNQHMSVKDLQSELSDLERVSRQIENLLQVA